MKGNMFLGYARGSVGDVVFSRVGGQQTARARNRRPANPRTQNQMLQRSLFANVVKCHNKGLHKLFRFAFEDKKGNESDYNAFMRHNAKNGVHISKQCSQSEVYPALGRWTLSYGTLPEAKVSRVTSSQANVFSIPCQGMSSGASTIGNVSSALIAAYGLHEGDILTIVHITSYGATSSNVPSIVPDSGLQSSDWEITQYILDSSSTESWPHSVDTNKVVFPFTNTSTDSYIQGVAVIFSRKTPNGLRVSTSSLCLNTVGETALTAAQQQGYIDQVLTSWSTADEAVLEGSEV